MKAKDIMTRHVITVSEDTPISDILTKLLEHRISGVPVTDAEGHVVGLVSEGDLILRETPPRRRSWWLSLFGDHRKMAEEFAKVHGLRARDVMTKPVVAVEEETPIREIAALLESRHIKRVPVLKAGRLVGIVSRADLVRALVVQPPVARGAVTDEEVRRAIHAILAEEPWVPVGAVTVMVQEGVVHLWGSVPSEEQKEAVRVAAEGVPGVREVIVHLAVAKEATFPPTGL